MILLDTNVVSEVRRSAGSPRVKALVKERSADTFVSAIVLGELRYGFALMADTGPRDRLIAWYDGLVMTFSHAILPVTREIGEIWGALQGEARRAGRALQVPDGLIAATALHHDLTLWTRNTGDFAGTGVRLFNPWED